MIVDGIRTHYWDAGEGLPVVLLHSGEFGASAEFTWERTIGSLAERYRVLAPDWLGYGDTDKIVDFGSPKARMLGHMTRFLDVMDVGPAAFIGSSMGGTVLVELLASAEPRWPVAAAVVASGGGFVPLNDARRALVDYQGDRDGMRRIVQALFCDPAVAADDAYVDRRHVASLRPGAWEATAASRFRSPARAPREEFGRPDTIPYEQVSVPVLLVAGSADKLREPGYAAEIRRRIPEARLAVLERCGHMPQLEDPDRFNTLVLDFLATDYTAAAREDCRDARPSPDQVAAIPQRHA